MSDKNTSIREIGLARLLQQFEGSVNLNELIGTYLDQVQAIEDAAWPLLGERSLDNATGDRLDGLGAIFNVRRGGRDDDAYRLRLKAEILVLASNGTAEEILEIAQAVIQMAVPNYTLLEYFPKTVYIRPVNHVMTIDPITVGKALRRSVSAATRMLFVASFFPDAESFTLSSQASASETSALLGLADDAQTTGGRLVNEF